MSQSNRPTMHIGCPKCETMLEATVPSGPGINDRSGNRLQGRKATCQNCGHQLELYYY